MSYDVDLSGQPTDIPPVPGADASEKPVSEKERMERVRLVLKSMMMGNYGGLSEQEIHESSRFGMNRHQRRKALKQVRVQRVKSGR
jgi:hypothetical protein